MNNSNKERSNFSSKGMYATLAFSLFAIILITVIAAWRTMKKPDFTSGLYEQSANKVNGVPTDMKKKEKLNNASTNTSTSAKNTSSTSNSSNNGGDDKNKIAKNTNNQSQKNESKVKSEENNKPVKKSTSKFIMPVADGKILQEFSGKNLVENRSLNEWRTHNGVDIKAKPNTPVKAIGDGVVCLVKRPKNSTWGNNINLDEDEDIRFDNDKFDKWGTYIVIDHGKGIKSYYCGLNEQVQVKPNDKVDSGQVIGSVGSAESNQMENAIGPHLHLVVTENDKFVNPMNYISSN